MGLNPLFPLHPPQEGKEKKLLDFIKNIDFLREFSIYIRRKTERISMATYREIQEWVRSNYGYTVKTCWIAHVKEMCGLQPNIAPNRFDLTKRLNPCPSNKVGPIKQAFKHFGMI